jgi:hypothetical protein
MFLFPFASIFVYRVISVSLAIFLVLTILAPVGYNHTIKIKVVEEDALLPFCIATGI